MHKIIVHWVNAHESYSESHRMLRLAIIELKDVLVLAEMWRN